MRPIRFPAVQGRARAKRIFWSIPRAVGQRRVGSRYALNDGYERVYLHHIRKTGGSSLTASFLALGGEDPLAVEQRIRDGWLKVTRTGDFVVTRRCGALQRGLYFFGWSHNPAWNIRLPERTFTVTILRDPAARVVSHYRYLADPRADESQAYPAKQRERQMAADGFDRFLDRISEAELLGQLQMFSPTREPQEAAERIRECSLVFGLDQMESGLVILSELIGHRLSLRHERRSVEKFQPSEAQAARLREALAPEYALMDLLKL